jgi:exosortase/archaeosortase family protein
MKLPFTISRKTWIILIVILTLAFIWAIMRFFILHYDPIRLLFIALFEPYLLLTEKLSNFILSFTCPGTEIINHTIFYQNTSLDNFDSGVLFKKWILLIILLFWIVRSPIKEKLLLTIIIMVIHFLIVSIDNAILADIVVNGYDEESLPKISRTPGLLALITLFTIWILRYRTTILDSLSKLKLNTKLIDNKIPEVIIVMYLYVILNNFLYGFFDLHIWRNLMITAVHKILTGMGYDSVIEGYYIVGNSGTVFIDRGCVGFNSILKFAVIVFLTGVNNRRRWSYIISGAVFLEIISGFRLIMIFVWYENFGFERAIHFHDLSKQAVHYIIFILWIIWFEFFTDIMPKQGKKKRKIYPLFIS